MGCFFGCFRFKDADRPKALISKSIATKTRDPLVTKNQLASVLFCEEKGSPCEKVGHLSLQENFTKGSTDEELKHEAKFLKSCGTLLETPAEIRKASARLMIQSPNGNGPPSNFQSRVTDTSCRKLHWEEKPGQISDTPAEVSGYPHPEENDYGGCHPEQHPDLRRSVQFEEVEHVSGNVSGVDCDVSPQTENQIQALGSEDSPYPTPLDLTQEMQTPGTVYPRKLGNLRAGNSTRIQTQYVYPVLNAVENQSQWMAIIEGKSLQSNDQFEQRLDSCAQDGGTMPQIKRSLVPNDSSVDGRSLNHDTVSKEVNFNQEDTPKLLGLSLSQWLKPPPTKDERQNYRRNRSHSDTDRPIIGSMAAHWNADEPPKDERQNYKINGSRERSYSDKISPDAADRPIIGSVAAHWNWNDDHEPSQVSPKWFDGNGIPNSTNKYKEDQKVSWHGTPFEERLEKALSDEKLFPRRNLDGRSIKLDEEEEGEQSDTAAS